MVGRNVHTRSTCETFDVMRDRTYVVVVEKRQNWRGQWNAGGIVRAALVFG
jgi:hypothetical protein